MLILLSSDSRQQKMLKKLFLIQVVTSYVTHSLSLKGVLPLGLTILAINTIFNVQLLVL